jgi:anaerobic selenocysteine-containing dehydrogenase
MKKLHLPDGGLKIEFGFRPQLRIIDYISTQRGGEERGPMIRISPTDAKVRLLTAGELAWVEGPRRHELAVVVIDDRVPDGSVIARDIAGVAVSEKIVVTKPDLDSQIPRPAVG